MLSFGHLRFRSDGEVFGDLEEPSCWDGIAVERRQFKPGWLDDLGAILHPAVITNEPRRLLEALAAGVRIYATNGCGLSPEDYLPIESFGAA
jgi:glycosyltransferase involved in cell wall biosynthesis